MKENVLEVLFYLYKNHLDLDAKWDDSQQDDLVLELEDKGFDRRKIDKAFHWLEQLSQKGLGSWPLLSKNSMRIFQHKECQKLSKESRGLIIFLEQIHILQPKIREIVIEQAMMLDSEVIEMEQTKWIILMVLCHQPEQKRQLDLLSDCIFSRTVEYLH